jgi:hypothetical protein
MVALVERRLVMTFKSLVSWLSAPPLMAFFLTFVLMFATVHAAEDLRNVTVVSFGLFGDQGVFRREATGAAQIVASRFGGGPVIVARGYFSVGWRAGSCGGCSWSSDVENPRKNDGAEIKKIAGF